MFTPTSTASRQVLLATFAMLASVPSVESADKQVAVKPFYANDFLPAYYQGTRVIPGPEPIPNIGHRSATTPLQKMERKLAAAMNNRLTDLKRLVMLEDTLVVWTTEFGRTPGQDGPKGCGHHPVCYSSWLAGGGTKGGIVYGATDELGGIVADKKIHTLDLHATILHLFGFDHEKLTYHHAGRDYLLTDAHSHDAHGHVVKDILS